MSGGLQPAATPPLSAKTSPNRQPMASPTSHTSPPPKTYPPQDVHELAQSHLASLLAEQAMVWHLCLHLLPRPPDHLHLQALSKPPLHPLARWVTTTQPATLLCCLDCELGPCLSEASTQTPLVLSAHQFSPQTGLPAVNEHPP